MDSVLRMRTARYSSVTVNADDDDEDVAVDFSNAVLYIGALQTIAATVLTSTVSILACVAVPGNVVSAIRTLVLSSIVGVAVVRRPFRLGRVHGLSLIFRALQPCVLIYIGSEIAEQLVHTCTRDASAPSWRRLVFHSMSAIMILSGFLRARRPLAQTDLPFLLTLLSLFAVAMLPPPAILLSGPLCATPTLSTAAERVVRAFIFSLLYSVFVYAAAPPVQSSQEVIICVMRASAASIWVLGAHTMLLPLAIVQGSLVIYKRIFGAEYALDDEHSPLTQTDEFDVEASASLDEAAASPTATAAATALAPSALGASDMITPHFQSFGARGLVDIGGTASTASASAHRASGFGDVNVAAVAARLEAEASPPSGLAGAA